MQTPRPTNGIFERLRSSAKIALLGAGLVGTGYYLHGAHGPTLVPAAEAAGAAVTPKTEVPSEAKALSHAFSSVANSSYQRT